VTITILYAFAWHFTGPLVKACGLSLDRVLSHLKVAGSVFFYRLFFVVGLAGREAGRVVFFSL